ncbi:hypothetical protein [Shewanella piezotolerans]|nr:hypothetical protein [Shewanella piezotolerans]
MDNLINQAAALGEKISLMTQGAAYNESDFSKIAFSELEKSNIKYDISGSELLAYQLNDLSRLAHNKENFSDFPIILFKNDDFIIQALHWYEASTSIHDHRFDGAFKVLKGSSIETTYDFNTSDDSSNRTQSGTLVKRRIRHLQVGDTCEINGGNRYIHSLFHIESPSITLIIRTHSKDSYPAQRDYHAPSLSSECFYQRAEANKLAGIINSDAGRLFSFDKEFYHQLFDNIEKFQIIRLIPMLVKKNDNLIKEVLINKYGEHEAAEIAKVTELTHCRRQLNFLRKGITDYESRLVIAVMINSSTRVETVQLLTEVLPNAVFEDEISKVVEYMVKHRWVPITIEGDSIADIITAAVSATTIDEYFSLLVEDFGAEAVDTGRAMLEKAWHQLTTNKTISMLWELK